MSAATNVRNDEEVRYALVKSGESAHESCSGRYARVSGGIQKSEEMVGVEEKRLQSSSHGSRGRFQRGRLELAAFRPRTPQS